MVKQFAVKCLLIGCVIASPLTGSSDLGIPHGRDSNGRTHYPYRGRHTIHVRSGQQIQDAIDNACDGDQIVVEAGTYAEQLTVNKNGISLIGHGAILVPPATFVPNTCTNLFGAGTQAGICVTGSGVSLADFVVEHRKVLSVDRPVEDVIIMGIQVKEFKGANIAVVGARNARVTGDSLTDGVVYGFLTDGSYNTLVSENTVVTSKLGSIGICMDNFDGVAVSGNKISGYYVGLCIQTAGADVHNNDASENCIGAFVDPRIDGANIHHNHFSALNSKCGPLPADAGIVYAGVFLSGATNTKARQNLIEGQTLHGHAAGVAIVDDPCTELALACVSNHTEALASGNRVEWNILRHNDLDLFVSTNGTGNVVKGNRCSTSIPKRLCD